MGTKTLLQLFKREGGFSLMEVMLGGGIMAGVGLAGAKIYKDQLASQQAITEYAKLNDHHNTLKKLLSSSANCNVTIKSYVGSSPAPIPSQDIGTLYTCNKHSDTACRENGALLRNAFTPGVYIPNAYLDVNDFVDPGNGNDAGYHTRWRIERMQLIGRSNSGPVVIRMHYRGRDTANGPGKLVTKDITLSTRFDGSNFQECIDSQESSVNNMQNTLCNTMNPGVITSTGVGHGVLAVWNPTTQQCEFTGSKSTCPPNMQVSVGNNGVATCRSITNSNDATDLNGGTTANCSPLQRPVLKFDPGTRKMRVECVP